MSQAPAKAIFLKDYLPPAFTTKETFLDFELLPEHTIVRSRLLVERNPKCGVPSNLFLLDGNELELLEVRVDGQPLGESEYQQTATSLSLEIDKDQFVFECTTRIYPDRNTALEGLYISGGMYCTQCEAEGFRRITFFQDRPDVLSVFTTKITADLDKYPTALSNGNLVTRTEENGKVIAEWHDPFPKPSYLFALVAGDLICQEDRFTTQSGRNVTLQIFVEQGNEHKCDHALASLKRSMTWDEEVYGREYDLDLFMIVAVDHFNMGAMENKGLNIFNSSCVLATPETATDDAFARIEGIVGHEYFHNWSGNRVTCRDWFQLSLKEGFTVFRDAEFSSDMGSRAVKRLEDVSFLRQHQFPEDAGPMAHAVRPASYMEISNFYTVTIYEKGSEVVGMLRTILGADLFRKGSDLYFDTFDGQAATTDDFVWAMEQVSGKDLTQFKRWYSQAGTPRLSVRRAFDAASQTLTLTAAQHTPETADGSKKEPFVIPVALGLVAQNGNALAIESEDKRFNAAQAVWLVEEAEQTLVINGIAELPAVSLLRDFSAPVLLEDDLTDQERILLIGNDPNGYNRWEQCQIIYKKLILQKVDAEFDEALLKALKQSLRQLLQDDAVENAVKAELLSLPAESEFLQLVPNIDILSVEAAREALRLWIATELFADFEQMFGSLESYSDYAFEPEQVGVRKLKNTLLEYLLLANLEQYQGIALAQFEQASNMTDQLSAFKYIVQYGDEAAANKVISVFLSQWADDVQVLEQWFRVQVSRSDENTLSRVKTLLDHELFEYQNPNKIRAVIGAFAMTNVKSFHAADGKGYEFLAEQVAKIDQMNPQIAARLVGPLTKWKSYDLSRGQKMKAQLDLLATKVLSKDLYEVVSKSLG
ncbi:aminopeptidase N [Litoribrevibacter albus]|uniref:Aminopeptidase N n=1 Tax=Litoribrevibacter albus TaxID=1473156 RepID=A0AA37W798_9GAMM|nr:aminopeptidase N [Litoribrevibacter albus]GLQ32320.1 aminopeptidase N [Litoribrevibacter albus]